MRMRSNSAGKLTGGCTGDKLYPVVMKATRLKKGKYYIEIMGLKIYKEYVLSYFI